MDKLPSTMPSPETGQTLTRDIRPFAVVYKGMSVTVDLPGLLPAGPGRRRACGR
jgi:HTH-type transcriptional regulator / antitoxin MqsA